MDSRASTSQSVKLEKPADKPCDIVMEGGAASGVVYPRALCELAKRYRFQRIGGTSAGAVAAALAAAAEYGRRTAERKGDADPASGFKKLADLPEWFAQTVEGRTRLKWLFAPEHDMRPAYELIMAFLSTRRFGYVALSLVMTGARCFPKSFGAGAVLGLALGALAVHGALQVGGGLGVVLTLAASILGLAAAGVFSVLLILLSFVVTVLCKLPRKHFGVAYGHSTKEQPSPPVTDWLNRLIQELSGKPMTEPLTFGDLDECHDKTVTDQGIALRLMTTCLTHGRPFRLPFGEDEVFYYDPEELKRFFPEEVMQSLKTNRNDKAPAYEGYEALPLADRFPIVVAARMSMSFPFFFSSIPLYAVDRTRKPLQKDRDKALSGAQPERCWFADGGICSNLPVHFFDRALPRWPTFAVDLRSFHRDLNPADPKHAVWIDRDFRDENGRSIITDWWSALPHEKGDVDRSLGTGAAFERTKAFLQAVLDTMMNWRDNTQLRPIGSRDRVAHVSLDEREGSFNLSMGKREIDQLAARGAAAGEKLREHFTNGGWRENRAARLFSFLSVTGEYLQYVKRANREPVAPDRSYVQDFEDLEFGAVGCTLSNEQKRFAAALLREIDAAALKIPDDTAPDSLASVAPPPRQTIRFLPEGEPPRRP